MGQVKQYCSELQVLHEAEHGLQVLETESKKVPVWHDEMHLPFELTKPSAQAVH